MTTRVTRLRVPYKWRHIFRNSLDTICRFDLENVSQVDSVSFAIAAGRWKILKKNPQESYSAPALIVSAILTFEIFNFEKVGEGHVVLLS